MNYLTPYCKFFYDTQMNGIELKKYEQTISFILDLIIECYEENRTYFNEVNSEVLIFCLIYSESKEKTKKLIKIILNQTYETYNTINDHYIYKSFITEKQEDFLLDWGLKCGNLSIACQSLKIFHNNKFVISDDKLKVLLNSLQIVILSLSEKNSLDFNYMIYIKFISKCLKIIKRKVMTMEIPDINIFHILLDLLKLNKSEFYHIYLEILQVINYYLIKQPSIQVQNDIFSLLFKIETKSYKAIKAIYEVLINIISYNHENMFNDNKYTYAFSLLPLLWNGNNDLVNYLYLIIGDYKEQFELIYQRSVENLNMIINEFLNSNDVNFSLILSFFEQLSKNGTLYEKDCVLLILNYLVSNNKVHENYSQNVYNIGCNSINHPHQLLGCKFIRSIVNNGFIFNSQCTYKEPYSFPKLSFINIDNFERIPIILELKCPTMQKVKKYASAIEIEPFTKIYNDIFKSQLQANITKYHFLSFNHDIKSSALKLVQEYENYNQISKANLIQMNTSCHDNNQLNEDNESQEKLNILSFSQSFEEICEL